MIFHNTLMIPIPNYSKLCLNTSLTSVWSLLTDSPPKSSWRTIGDDFWLQLLFDLWLSFLILFGIFSCLILKNITSLLLKIFLFTRSQIANQTCTFEIQDINRLFGLCIGHKLFIKWRYFLFTRRYQFLLSFIFPSVFDSPCTTLASPLHYA